MILKDWRNQKSYWTKGVLFGGLIGIILSVLNLFLAGIIGFIFLFPIRFLPVTVNNYIQYSILNCHGEGCWGAMIIIGSLWILILFVLIGFFIGWIIGKTKSE